MKLLPASHAKLRRFLLILRALALVIMLLCLGGGIALGVQFFLEKRDIFEVILGFIFIIIFGAVSAAVFVLTNKALAVIGRIKQQSELLKQWMETVKAEKAEQRYYEENE